MDGVHYRWVYKVDQLYSYTDDRVHYYYSLVRYGNSRQRTEPVCACCVGTLYGLLARVCRGCGCNVCATCVVWIDAKTAYDYCLDCARNGEL